MEEIDRVIAQFLKVNNENRVETEVILSEIRVILLKVWLKKSEALAMIDSWYFLNKLKAASMSCKKLKGLGPN
jgi:hypothetical protein